MPTLALKRLAEVRLAALVVSILYLLIFYMMLDLKSENIIIVAIYNVLIYVSSKTRKFVLAFTIFIVFGVLYDLMKLWPNYLFNAVDIGPLYHFEKAIFGFSSMNGIVTPNEYFSVNHSPFLDFLTGIIYLNWVPVPIAFAFFLYLKDKKLFLDYSLAFLLVNLIGFSIYYLHPAAPPWYVGVHGFDFHQVSGDAASLSRFDAMVGLPLFESIYSRNSNVFAAVPSLHCAYPVVLLFFGLKYSKPFLRSEMRKHRKGAKLFIIVMVLFLSGIWFSAVYSNHHYVTDVILGVFCAITGLVLYQQVLLKFAGFRKFVERYYDLIR